MTSLCSRRSILKSAALLPFAAAGLPLGNAIAAIETTHLSNGSHLKTSINAYCFDPLLKENLKDPSTGMSLFDVLSYCAEQNVDAIDPTGYYFPGYPEVPRDKFLNEFKRRAFELGLDISGTGIKNDFASPNAAARAADVERAKQWIEAAARLGAPVLRVFAGPVPPKPHSWDDGAKWMADALHQCVEHGEKYGVIVGLQNHGDMLQTADECLKVLDMVKSQRGEPGVDCGRVAGVAPGLHGAHRQLVGGRQRDGNGVILGVVVDDHDGGDVDAVGRQQRAQAPAEHVPAVVGDDHDADPMPGRLLKVGHGAHEAV